MGKASGFSLHVGVAAEAHERHKLERMYCNITRLAIAEQRLLVTAQGWVRYLLKTLSSDSTTYGVFDPVEFISRLAALVPKLRDLTTVTNREIEKDMNKFSHCLR